ncbi:sodium ion-translocating decarboxylase subunit beta [Candidatus Bathyarchaeota archaeon]|nr:sodium ion-translocating decarboxylase subunit beta [Candidatus Bathyarchaeota archaeon]
MGLWQLAGNLLMMGVGLVLIYLAISKGYEPLLLLPIGFGSLLANIPQGGLASSGGLLYLLRAYGIETEILPALLFVGIGAMCDFSGLIAHPGLLALAFAGQLGIFVTLNLALLLGFSPLEAGSISIIGAMDGPTAIIVAKRFAPHLLGPVAVSAYSYMSMVPLLQTPLSRLITTRGERLARMEFPAEEEAPSRLRVVFPIAVFLASSLIAPQGALLMGCLMLGNLMKESGVVKRLHETAERELEDIVLLLLGLSIGGTMEAEAFLNPTTVMVFALGLAAFTSSIVLGLLIGKILYHLTGGRFNPLLGACGISAFPIAARVAHLLGRKEDPDNWLLPYALAINMGGQIASVAAGGAILTYAPVILSMLG